MHKILALALAATAVLPPLVPQAQAQPRVYAPARVDQMRAGRFLVTVFAGAPADEWNARNSLSRGIRVFERPRRSTFAAVAAQEIFEFDMKARGGGINKIDMEIISHEIESLVASRYGGFSLTAFEQKEAETLTHYARFRGMSVGEVVARMRAARPFAERWLAQNRDVVRDLVSYRFPR